MLTWIKFDIKILADSWVGTKTILDNLQFKCWLGSDLTEFRYKTDLDFWLKAEDNLHLLFSCLTRFPPVNFRNSDNFNNFTLASQLQLLNWQTPNDNFWNKFEIQAFEQIGNVKKAQIHILFRQNLEKRFVDFLTKSRNSCY